MFKYYEVIGTINGEKEVLYGSYSEEDCKDQLDFEQDSWKDCGYKKLAIVSRKTSEAPDPDLYPEEYALGLRRQAQ